MLVGVDLPDIHDVSGATIAIIISVVALIVQVRLWQIERRDRIAADAERLQPHLLVRITVPDPAAEWNGFRPHSAVVVATNVGHIPITIEGVPVIRSANDTQRLGVLRHDWETPQAGGERHLEPSASFAFRVSCAVLADHAVKAGLSGVVSLVAIVATSHQTQAISEPLEFDLDAPWPPPPKAPRWGLA